MKNIFIKAKDKFLVIYLILNLLYILVGSYMVFNSIIKYQILSYGYIFFLILNLIIILAIIFTNKYKKNIIDIFLIFIIVFACISAIFAFKPEKALYGEFGRYEGLYVICYYISTVFLASNLKKEDKKIIIYSILLFGFIQCIYAICQKLNLFNVHTRIVRGWRWATGFTGNRNSFGTLMLICICYSIGLYIDSKNKTKTIFLLVLSFLFSIGILLSKTRSCMLALLFIMIILLIYCLKRKYIKKYIMLVIVLLFATILMQYLNYTPVFRFINTAKTEITEIAKGNLDDDFGSQRIGLWKETFKIVPKYLIHGIGIDNFGNVNNGKPIHTSKHVFNKAHNEYLQILVTMGIFSLISYISLHFIIIKNGIKNVLKDKKICLLLPVIGYIIQAQFNISVIEVAPLFYIALGLLADRNKSIESKK